MNWLTCIILLSVSLLYIPKDFKYVKYCIIFYINKFIYVKIIVFYMFIAFLYAKIYYFKIKDFEIIYFCVFLYLIKVCRSIAFDFDDCLQSSKSKAIEVLNIHSH